MKLLLIVLCSFLIQESSGSFLSNFSAVLGEVGVGIEHILKDIIRDVKDTFRAVGDVFEGKDSDGGTNETATNVIVVSDLKTVELPKEDTHSAISVSTKILNSAEKSLHFEQSSNVPSVQLHNTNHVYSSLSEISNNSEENHFTVGNKGSSVTEISIKTTQRVIENANQNNGTEIFEEIKSFSNNLNINIGSPNPLKSEINIGESKKHRLHENDPPVYPSDTLRNINSVQIINNNINVTHNTRNVPLMFVNKHKTGEIHEYPLTNKKKSHAKSEHKIGVQVNVSIKKSVSNEADNETEPPNRDFPSQIIKNITFNEKRPLNHPKIQNLSAQYPKFKQKKNVLNVITVTKNRSKEINQNLSNLVPLGNIKKYELKQAEIDDSLLKIDNMKSTRKNYYNLSNSKFPKSKNNAVNGTGDVFKMTGLIYNDTSRPKVTNHNYKMNAKTLEQGKIKNKTNSNLNKNVKLNSNFESQDNEIAHNFEKIIERNRNVSSLRIKISNETNILTPELYKTKHFPLIVSKYFLGKTNKSLGSIRDKLCNSKGSNLTKLNNVTTNLSNHYDNMINATGNVLNSIGKPSSTLLKSLLMSKIRNISRNNETTVLTIDSNRKNIFREGEKSGLKMSNYNLNLFNKANNTLLKNLNSEINNTTFSNKCSTKPDHFSKLQEFNSDLNSALVNNKKNIDSNQNVFNKDISHSNKTPGNYSIEAIQKSDEFNLPKNSTNKNNETIRNVFAIKENNLIEPDNNTEHNAFNHFAKQNISQMRRESIVNITFAEKNMSVNLSKPVIYNEKNKGNLLNSTIGKKYYKPNIAKTSIIKGNDYNDNRIVRQVISTITDSTIEENTKHNQTSFIKSLMNERSIVNDLSASAENDKAQRSGNYTAIKTISNETTHNESDQYNGVNRFINEHLDENIVDVDSQVNNFETMSDINQSDYGSNGNIDINNDVYSKDYSYDYQENNYDEYDDSNLEHESENEGTNISDYGDYNNDNIYGDKNHITT